MQDRWTPSRKRVQPHEASSSSTMEKKDGPETQGCKGSLDKRRARPMDFDFDEAQQGREEKKRTHSDSRRSILT
eukprot:9496679-Pyramimonas_sp.AAC.1